MMTSLPCDYTGWIVLLATLVITPTITYRHGGGNDILGLDIPTDPYLDLNTVCGTFPDLTNEQYILCSRFPDVTASAIQGLQIAVHECQYQFRQHRWNCSALERKNKNPHSSPLLGRGYKETAFAYAVSAAGVVSQVARACSLGKLQSCGCQPELDQKTNAWKWKGCNHNVEFGVNFAKKFLDSKEMAKDLQSKINLHNNRVGRLAVEHNVEEICKCHGMSGSCEVQTCWKTSSSFRLVGNHLKAKYSDARKMENTNVANGRLRMLREKKKRRRRRRPRRDTLVFYEQSPNFCDPDSKVDSLGTSGRYCNKTSTDIDNCETLCCGRGYNTMKVTRVERCHCRFHWCCYVVCKKCIISDWVTVCK